MYEMRNLCPGLEGGEKEEEEKKSNLSQKQLFGISFSTVRNCRKKKKKTESSNLFICLFTSAFTEKSGFCRFPIVAFRLPVMGNGSCTNRKPTWVQSSP